jgi:hypothetical protein
MYTPNSYKSDNVMSRSVPARGRFQSPAAGPKTRSEGYGQENVRTCAEEKKKNGTQSGGQRALNTSLYRRHSLAATSGLSFRRSEQLDVNQPENSTQPHPEHEIRIIKNIRV